MNDKIKIAKFMGHRVEYYATIPPIPTGMVIINGKMHYMDYDTSWELLMPVVEEIESLQLVRDFIISSIGCTLMVDNMPRKFFPIEQGKVKCVYQAVVEFLNWYNEQAK